MDWRGEEMGWEGFGSVEGEKSEASGSMDCDWLEG